MPNWSDDEGRPSEDSPLKRQKMTVWIYSETDGDAGDYNIKVFSSLEKVEMYKLDRDNAYAKIREYEVDAAPVKKDPFRYDDPVLCPECDGPMIARTGQYGKFWGCKNYPECKGTRDSQGRSKKDREKWKNEQRDNKTINELSGDEHQTRNNMEAGIKWKK